MAVDKVLWGTSPKADAPRDKSEQSSLWRATNDLRSLSDALS